MASQHYYEAEPELLSPRSALLSPRTRERGRLTEEVAHAPPPTHSSSCIPRPSEREADCCGGAQEILRTARQYLPMISAIIIKSPLALVDVHNTVFLHRRFRKMSESVHSMRMTHAHEFSAHDDTTCACVEKMTGQYACVLILAHMSHHSSYMYTCHIIMRA